MHSDVRFAVAFALPYEDERAIAALVDLSADPDEDVRDWATFGPFGWLAVEAAAELVDPRLYPLLVRIRDEITELAEYEKADLVEAIRRCGA